MRFFRRTLLAALLVTAPAWSQTPEQEANARFQAGLRYYDAHEFEPARLAFTQAYSVLPKPGILINLALSELYSGHELESLSHLEQYLADPSAPADKRDRAQRAMDEAMKKTSHLAIKSSSGAEVRVDGKLASLATVHVMPGTHALEAKLADKVRNQSVDVKAGEKRDVDLSFDAPSQPVSQPIAPPPSGGDVTPPPRVEQDEGSIFGIRSVAGAVLLVGGGVMLGVGLKASGDATDNKNMVSKLTAGRPTNLCTTTPSDPVCGQLSTARSDQSDAESRRTTFFVVGSVTAVVGVGLLVSAFVHPHRAFIGKLTPSFAPGDARLNFATTF